MTEQELSELITRVQALERKAEDDRRLIMEAVKLAMKALRVGLGIEDPNQVKNPNRWELTGST